MAWRKKEEGFGALGGLAPVAVTFLLLCAANYGMDALMWRLGIEGSKTIVNDVMIGLLGAVAVFYYLSATHEKHAYEQARERIVLIGQLNLRIRQSLAMLTSSALSDDPGARLMGIDEAMDRIDELLSDFQAGRGTLGRGYHSEGLRG